MFSIDKKKLTFLVSSSMIVAILQFAQVLFSGFYFTLEQLGNLAIIQLILNIAIGFSDAGILNLIIQRKKLTKSFLNQLSNFLILFIIIYNLVFFTVVYYLQLNTLLLTDINFNMILLIPGILISMFITFNYNYLMRLSNFDYTSKVDIKVSTTQVLFFVCFSLLDLGVESLIYAWYISISLKLFLLKSQNIKNNFEVAVDFKSINKRVFKFFGQYQFYQFSERIINIFSTQLDIIIISSLFGKEALGAYSFIKNISLKGIQLISMLFHKVLFPSLVALKRKSQQEYINALQNFNLFLFIGIIFIVLNFSFSSLVILFYKNKFLDYNDLVYYFQFQAFYIFLITVTTSFFLSTNKIKKIVLLNLLGVISLTTSYLLIKQFNYNIEEFMFWFLIIEFSLASIYLFRLNILELYIFFIVLITTLYFDNKILLSIIFIIFVIYSLLKIYINRKNLVRYFHYDK